MIYATGIDLGGSSIKAVTVTPTGKFRAEANLAFDPQAEMDWAGKIRGLVQQIEKKRGEPPKHLGISAPGLTATDGRSIAHMPGRLQGLEKLDWSKLLGTRRVVPVLNDAHAALLGESWLGAARGYQNVILLTLGTGVGGAAIVDGRLLHGQIGRAGHLGHVSLDPDGVPDICGAPGSLERAIGNCTIEERSHGRFTTTHELIQAYLTGDPVAQTVWTKSVKALAAAVCSFINVLDPQAVIIGGGIARAGDALFKPLEQLLAPMEWRPGGQRVKLLPAELGEFAGAIGAAYNAYRCGGAKVEGGPWRVDMVPYVHRNA